MKLSFALGLILTMSTAMAQVPDWYASHKHRMYQPDLYIIGVGSAGGSDAIEKAKKNAQADIVSQIKVQVKNEIRTVTESFQLNQDEAVASEFRSQSRTLVNEELTGAAIVETFLDPSTQTAYALAALDRDRYCAGLRTDLTGAWTQASELRMSAVQFLQRGKFSDAVHAIADARALLVAALPKKALHDAVASKPFVPPDATTPMLLTTAIRTLISKVHLDKIGGDKQSGKIGEPFGAPFEVRAVYESIPVSAGALVCESTDGMRLGDAVTDEDGLASFTAHVRMLPGNALRVRMALPGLSKEFDRNIIAAAAVFSFTPHLSDRGFELVAADMARQAADALKGRVASAVSTIGYRVLPVSRYRLTLSMQTAPPVKNEGFSGTMTTVKIDAAVTLTDNQTGAVIGTYSASAAGGGRTEEEAVTKAAAAVSFDRMKLADLLEKLQQE